MLKPTYMVSRMVSSLPSVPQVAQTDFDVGVCNAVTHKPYISFAPVCPEGCMLMVWTKETYTENGKDYFRHYYIYIPCGSILFLPGDTIHAGGFSFGCVTGKEFSNQCIHFYICSGNGCDVLSRIDAENGMNFNYHAPEYVPEPGPLSVIQARLNDRRIDYMI